MFGIKPCNVILGLLDMPAPVLGVYGNKVALQLQGLHTIIHSA